MKKRISMFIALALLLLASIPAIAWLADNTIAAFSIKSYIHKSYFESGDGTSANQYQTYDANGDPIIHYDDETGCAFEIKYPVQLYYFAWLQYMGYFNVPDESGTAINQVYFYLSADLDMSDWVLPPIGSQDFQFVGNFNGNGHTISNLTIQNVPTIAETLNDIPVNSVNNLNIVGFFGVVGSLSDSDTVNGAVAFDANTGYYSPALGPYGNGYTYSSAVNEVKNVIVENANIKTDLSKSLVGIAAGYVNGPMENVKVVGGTISNISATDYLNDDYTTNLSDFGAVGYCTEDYKDTNLVTTVLVYDPQVYSNAQGTALGQGNNWGNSIDMKSMYNDLLDVYNGFTTPAAPNEVGRNVITITKTDGEVSGVTVTGDGQPAYANNFHLKIVEKKDGTDSVAYFSLVERSTSFMYLYGGKTYISEDVEEDAFYIHTGEATPAHYFSLDNQFAVTDIGTQGSSTKWIIKDGYIFYVKATSVTEPESGETSTVYDFYYVIKNGSNQLEIVEVSQLESTPAEVTNSLWTVGEDSITTGGYALVFSNGSWTLEQVSLYISDNAGENFLSVNSTPAIVNQTISANATQWIKESVDGNATGFYLATTINGTKYYLFCANTGVIGLVTSNPTIWFEDAPASGNHKVYMLTDETNGFAIYYSTTNGWSTTNYTTAGHGSDWGGSLDMANIFAREQDIYHNIINPQAKVANNQYEYTIDSLGSGKYNLIYGNYNTDITYYIAHFGTGSYVPLSVNDDYSVEEGNTGYIVGGHSGTAPLGANVRVSQYPIHALSNAYDNMPKVYVRLGDGRYLKNDNGTSAFVSSKEDASQFYIAKNNGGTNTAFRIYDGSKYLYYDGRFTNNGSNFIYTHNYCLKQYDNASRYIALSGNRLITETSLASATQLYFEYVDEAFNEMSVFTRTASSGGVKEITTENLYGLGKNYENAREKMKSVLNGTPGFVNGLHFMNTYISANSTITVPKALIDGESFTVLPQNCIDFHVKDTGFISFFAGTYYYANSEYNEAFFSLHKINRNNNGTINSIQEIKKVYERKNPATGQEKYVYYYSGTDNYAGDTSNYTMVFDTSWISSNTSVGNYINSVFYFEIPVNPGEYALGSTTSDGAYLFYLDISASATIEGDSKIVDGLSIETNTTDAGKLSYTEIEPTENETSTYFPLAWNRYGEGNAHDYRGDIPADSNTGYVISGSNTSSAIPGDIRVSQYTKYAGGNWASIRNSLTSTNNAGVLNDARVYTIIDGTQRNISDYGIGKLHTMQYGSVSKTVNELLQGNQYVYGLHFMNAQISIDNTVTVSKAIINGVTKTNYVMPQDCIDFVVAQKGRIAFMAGTYYSGSNGVQSFFSLHRIFRDGSGNITSIKQLSEIYSDGDTSHGYIYRYKGDNRYYNADGSLNGNSVPSGYTRVYDLRAIDSPTELTGNALTQNSVYYFEIPVDAGEYALGSSNSDGAYLIYLDIAANASFSVQTTTIEVTEQKEYELNTPNGVAFADSADSVAFNDGEENVDPTKSVFVSIPVATSSGDTEFSITSGGAMTVTSDSSLSSYTPQSIPIGGSLSVNGTPVSMPLARRIVVEKVTTISLDMGGTTTTTVVTTTQTTVGNNSPTTTVTQTVTTEFNGSSSSTTTTTDYGENYEGHTLIPVTDYTVQPNANAQTILEYSFTGNNLTNTIERNGDLNTEATEYTVTINGVTYSVFDVIKSTGTDDEVTPAGRYDVTISGSDGTYTVNVIVLNDDFVFYINNVLVDETGNRSVTISSP